MTKLQRATAKESGFVEGMGGLFPFPVADFLGFGFLDALRFLGCGLVFGVVLVDFVCDVFEADVDFVDAFELLYGFGVFAPFFEDGA